MPKFKNHDPLNYEKPTEAEVALVLDHWEQVARVVREGGVDPARPVPKVDSDLLARVATHQRWQKAMSCEHQSGITMQYDEPYRCSDCDRPMRFLSDVQIQALKEA